jgi:hypothetical protein
MYLTAVPDNTFSASYREVGELVPRRRLERKTPEIFSTPTLCSSLNPRQSRVVAARHRTVLLRASIILRRRSTNPGTARINASINSSSTPAVDVRKARSL